jgi:DUF4097 and DUF4098 domain-containing protein YvlB
MSDVAAPIEGSGGRSGCALLLGILLIATGALFLAQNLFDYALLPLFRQGVVLFTDYWPLLLVLWGLFKVYQRFARPARAGVGALEIVLLVLIVITGLSLSAARRVLEQVSGENLEDIVELGTISLVGAPVHRFPAEERFDPGASAGVVIVSTGGSVKIRGGEGTEIEVRLEKRVHHVSESEASAIAGGVKLDFDASGPLARLAVVLPEGNTPVDCDLDVRLPKGVSVAIENRRGPVSAFDMDGSVRIETAHAEIEAENLSGGLKATTRHGGIRVTGIAGTVELVTRGGAIVAEDVQGDLQAETSHGRLLVEDVTGGAALENRHAAVQASRIGGELRVTAQHSDVSIETAGASVSVSNSHGSIFVRGVRGALTIEATNAPIQARDVSGDVQIADRDETVTLVGVRGSVRVRSPMSQVTVEEVDGAVEIENSHDDVTVAAFGSTLSVRSTHAEVKVSTARLGGNVSLQTTYGDVELRLPRGASLRFEGRARDGELRSNVPGLEILEDRRGTERAWSGSLGSSTHAITVETSYGDILLEPVES